MALSKCRECGQEVSTDAKTCPHCGKKTPTGTSRATWGCLTIIVLLVVAAMLDHGDGTHASAPSTIPPARASADCQRAITAKLRSPSTANFPALEQVWAANDTAAMIVGVVDAQNGFGGTVRDSLICLFQRATTSNDWTLHRSAIGSR